MAGSSRFGTGGYVVGGGLALLGVGLLAYGTYLFWQAAESTSWPRADGRIVSSEVEWSGSHRDKGKPVIDYEFSAGGKTVHGHRVKAANVTGFGTGSAADVVNNYPAGKGVTVYFDPDNPSFAVLEPGVTFSALVMPGMGLAFLCGGVLFLWLTSREQETTE